MPDLTGGTTFTSGQSVTHGDLNNLVGNATINDNAVVTAKINNSAVTTAKILDANVTTAKVADNAVTYAKIQDTVTDNRLLGAATAGEVGEVQVATDMVADNAITPAKMEDGTQGDVLVYGASGAPERLGTGTSGQVLTAGGVGATPSWSTTQTIGFTSNQGTPTTTSLGSSYTHWGTCTLTLPADKTWVWVKVVLSGRVDLGKIVAQDYFKITTDTDTTTLLDTQQTDAGWVCIDSKVQCRDDQDSTHFSRIAEGVPVGRDGGADCTTNTTLDLKIYFVGGAGGDDTGHRKLYAVGQYA